MSKGAAKKHEFLAYIGGVGRSVDGELPHFNISPWIRERFNMTWKVREQNLFGRRPRFALSNAARYEAKGHLRFRTQELDRSLFSEIQRHRPYKQFVRCASF